MIKNKINQDNNFKFLKKIIYYIKSIKIIGNKDIPLYLLISYLYKQIKIVGIAERASILSFNMLMAFPPSLMFIFSLTPYIPLLTGKFHKEILLFIKDFVPDKLMYQNISIIVTELFYKPKNTIYSLSFFLFLFFASNSIVVIMKGFDKSIENIRKRHFITRRIVAIIVTLILFLFFIFGIFILSAEKYFILKIIYKLNLTSLNYKNIISNSRIIIASLFIFFTIAFIYKFIPSNKRKWNFFSAGAIIASIFYLIIVVFFNYWALNYMLYYQKYGPLGTIVFVMTLIYLFNFILLVGFEINLSIDKIKQIIKKQKAN